MIAPGRTHPRSRCPWRLSAALAVIAFLVAAPAASRAEEPASETMPPIVETAIDFHGGDVYRSSRVALTLTSRSGSSRIEATVDGGRFDYVVTAPAEGEPQRRVRFTNEDGSNRTYGWRDGEWVELDGEAARRARSWLASKVYFPFLPFRLADPGVHFRDLGIEVWDSRPLRKVKVTFSPGSSSGADDEYLYWFEPESGRMVQYAYSFHSGDGGLRLRRVVDEHRVGGLLLSDQENLGVDGGGHPVDRITPQFAAEHLEPVSTVELSDIEVEPLS